MLRFFLAQKGAELTEVVAKLGREFHAGGTVTERLLEVDDVVGYLKQQERKELLKSSCRYFLMPFSSA